MKSTSDKNIINPTLPIGLKIKKEWNARSNTAKLKMLIED